MFKDKTLLITGGTGSFGNAIMKRFDIEGKFVILGVTSFWGERKGLKYFVDLSKNLKDDEAIVSVGLSQEQQNKLPKNIIGASRTNSTKELAEIYTTADVFVNPTLEDNFSTTSLESLACGTPVITFDTGGSPEAIDNQTGIVVEKGNFESLLNAIEIVKCRGKAYYSENCIRKSLLHYNKNNKFIQYVNLCKNITDGKTGELDGNDY